MKTLSMLFFSVLIFQTKLFAQQNPNSFLGIKIGQSENDFIRDYPSASSNSDELLTLHSTIDHENMTLHSVQKTTSSGDKVRVDCYFKNLKLAVLCIEYIDYQFDNSILKGLAAKYGHYSKSKIYDFTDPLNGQERTVIVITWTQFNTSILEYNSTEEFGHPHFIIADKSVQLSIARKKSKSNISKIE